MIGFIVDTEFVWGFQAKVIGLSKTSPSFYYPPPTTFLGAMAEVIAKENEIGEEVGRKIVSKLSENLLAIGVRPINCKPVKYEDLNRIITIRKVGVKDKITGKDIGILAPHPLYLDKSFDSPARGKTILTSLNNEPPKLRWFVVFKDDAIKFNGRPIRLDEGKFWKIHRISSKESIVSIVDVKAFEPERVEGELKTTYSFPFTSEVKIVEEVWRRNWVYEVYINPFNFSDPVKDYIEGKSLLAFKVPILNKAWEEYYCRVDGIGYRFGDEVVVGWSR